MNLQAKEESRAVNAQLQHNQEKERDLPCVWMMAGILNYKLCDRQYGCEQCELDRVLRGENLQGSHPPSPELPADTQQLTEFDKLVNSYLSNIISGSKLYLDRCYSSSHFWMYPEDEETVVVGLDSNMLKLLYPLTKIVPPDENAELKRNQLCTILVRDDMTVPLHAPFNGRVMEVNHAHIEMLSDGYPSEDDSWYLKMKPHEKVQGMDDLCRGDEMLRWYVQKIQLVKNYLRKGISQSQIEEVGMTMADGGEMQLNLEMLLGTQEYRKLVNEIFQIS